MLRAQHLGGDRPVGPAAQRELHVTEHVVAHAELAELVAARDAEQGAQSRGEGEVEADQAVVAHGDAVRGGGEATPAHACIPETQRRLVGLRGQG